MSTLTVAALPRAKDLVPEPMRPDAGTAGGMPHAPGCIMRRGGIKVIVSTNSCISQGGTS